MSELKVSICGQERRLRLGFEKDAGAAPENKALGGAPENKSAASRLEASFRSRYAHQFQTDGCCHRA